MTVVDGARIAADVAVFGSGPAGVSAAAALLDAGCRVTMFDAGRRGTTAPPADSFMTMRTRDHQQWRTLLGPDFEGLEQFSKLSPKFRVPRLKYVFEDFAQLYRLDTEGAAVQGSLAAGGLSNAWGAGVARYDDDDLGDTPIRSADLAASYAMIAGRMGLSGNASDAFGGSLGGGLPLQPAPMMDRGIRLLLERHGHRPQVADRYRMRIGQPVSAVITEPAQQRQACIGCGQCILGCARNAIYSAQFDLDALLKHPNFSFRDDIVAEQVKIEDGRPLVAAKRLSDGLNLHIDANAVVLACGAIGTAAVVLRSLNVSKAVPLHSSPVAVFALVLPEMLGNAVPSEFFALSQLNLTVPDGTGGYVFGSVYASHGIPIADLVSRSPLGRASSIKLFRILTPAVLVCMFWLHSKFSRNTLTVKPDGATSIVGGFAGDHAEVMTAASKVIARVFRRHGAWMIPGSLWVGMPCADSHYAGTVPMRSDPLLHETSPDGEVRGLPGVYVVDGAALAAIPPKPHTFTVMANADRIARGLARRLGH